jgi:alpha-beta hydrolase superfamily lysophospholipase
MTVAADAPAGDPAVAALHRGMPLTRLVDCGMDPADARALHARTAAGEDWAGAAAALAGARLDKARRALAAGHPLTALTQARWAAGAALFAQMADNQDTERKRVLYRRYTETVGYVATLDGTQRVSVPHAGGQLTGWLRRPAAQPSLGTVIVWGGLSGWGAAYLRTADAITARGLACLLAEGPGQGEPRLDHGLYMDGRAPDGFARFVDTVGEDPTLPGPVAVMGNSFGGLFAALLAAQDPRVAACVVNGAPPAPGVPEFRTAREQMDAAFGTRDRDTLAGMLGQLRFDPSRQRIGCPVLVLHGGADPLVDRAQAEAFAGASARGRLEWWPDGEHTIYNHAGERDALVGDWLADVLAEAASLCDTNRFAV